MEDEQKAVKDEKEIVSDSPTDEASKVKETEVKPEKTDKSTKEPETKDVKKPTGAEKRIHKLVDERDEAKAKAASLKDKLAELTATAQTPEPQVQPQEGGERELTIDDLRTIARLEVDKEKTVNRINSQAREAERTYPVLDPNSDQFDAEVSEAVSTAVNNEVRLDSSKDVLKLTKKYMKPYHKAAERAVGEEKANLAKQAKEATLKPMNVKAVDKKLEDKTIEELEEELEIVY